MAGLDARSLGRLADAVGDHRFEKLFHWRTPEAYEARRQARAARTGRAEPDLNLYFSLAVPDASEAWAIVTALNDLPFVEKAYMEARPIPPADPSTPDYQPLQGYLLASESHGIDTAAAWAEPGGTGTGVSVIDLEGGWNLSHEDLPSGIEVLFGTNAPHDHGTAVLGILVALDDDHGVTGIVPDATVDVVSVTGAAYADAIGAAATHLGEGDILILELQVPGPEGSGVCTEAEQDGCVPVEWEDAVATAIQDATDSGIIVVEAAANGGNNLDDEDVYGTVFRSSGRNPGAILVGAGGTEAPEPESFSNYGERVILQGWGEAVLTTGPASSVYSDLGENRQYGYFNGTSAATPIVAGALAALQGIYRNRSEGRSGTATFLTDILVNTGTAQTGTHHVGPRPDLGEAIPRMLEDMDSDGDGLPDSSEIAIGTDRFNPDTDGDGLLDGEELCNPLSTDSDGDGLGDGDEVRIYGTDPCWSDTDGDGLGDGAEVLLYGTDPTVPDSDGDTIDRMNRPAVKPRTDHQARRWQDERGRRDAA